MDEGARGSADQPADRRISGSAQRISASADQSLLDQRSPRIAEPADLQISGSLGGSADQRISPWMNQRSQRINGSADHSADQRISGSVLGSAEPADQRISGSLGGSAAPADQRIRESQRLGQCRLDRKSFPQRTCPIIGVSFGPASQASSSSSSLRSLQELGVAEDRVCQVS